MFGDSDESDSDDMFKKQEIMKSKMRQSQKNPMKKKVALKKGGFFGGDSSDDDSEDGLGFMGSKRPIMRSKTTKDKKILPKKFDAKK